MSERDELADILMSDALLGNSDEEFGRDYALAEADAILAAGYSKPRTITTAEELDALPPSAIIKGAGGTTYEKQIDGPWHDGPHDWQSFEGLFWDSWDVRLPATVLYVPEAAS